MGAATSAARKHFIRPMKNYNVEERAMKVISKDKPTAAPPHPSMKKIMDDIMSDPSKLKTDRSDPRLLQNLSKVYITSAGDNPEVIAKSRLPVERTPPVQSVFGHEEPKVIPPGKASLRQILEFVAYHANDRDTYTIEKISKDYKLDILDTINILQHYKTLQVFHAPKEKPKKSSNPLRRLQDGIDNLKK
ncbi:NADH dehydrogenase [ubiquinone] 1 alpha subcomplex assembly factor 4 [Orchesella cincta]|uniref:NADH dehydrogenase [ubiquinone] 1 alpha subcomplex assembly factor 4 n=1 Tax=Orchesella cincta TaxID=48709 RepID=A0A1D2NBB9_ORCCI|nr:NADH dehydrogenase [ubiquinone] 1 alpha subcomplex assembly factor 4 [Orchesella cincta]